jgi:hypothetical protein
MGSDFQMGGAFDSSTTRSLAFVFLVTPNCQDNGFYALDSFQIKCY